MEETKIAQPEVIELDITNLEESEVNPRILPPKNYRALRESLGRFGNVGVVVWNKRSNRVVGGNKRLTILKESGITKTPAIVVDLSDEDEIALLIELNNQASMGVWDPKPALERIDRVKKDRPELFYALNFGVLQRDLQEPKPKRVDDEKFSGIPEMELLPFEHWDTIVIVFKDARDWLVAVEALGLKKAKITTGSGKVKMGLQRTVDGKEFLKKIGAER